MKFRLRQAKSSDFPAIQVLLRQAKLAGSWFTRKRYLKMLARNRGFFWVAEGDGEIAGNIFGSHDGAHHGYIYKLAVGPAYRSLGIAEALLSKLSSRFKKAKIIWQFALIEKSNATSARLFRQHGFELLKDYTLASLITK